MKPEMIKALYESALQFDQEGISNIIGISHVEGQLLYVCTELTNWQGSLDEFRTFFSEERAEMKRHVEQDVGEASHADKGMYHGIIIAESIINKSKTVEEARNRLYEIERVLANGRMLYHKMKLENPYGSYHSFIKNIISSDDLHLDQIPLEVSLQHFAPDQD